MDFASWEVFFEGSAAEADALGLAEADLGSVEACVLARVTPVPQAVVLRVADQLQRSQNIGYQDLLDRRSSFLYEFLSERSMIDRRRQ